MNSFIRIQQVDHDFVPAAGSMNWMWQPDVALGASALQVWNDNTRHIIYVDRENIFARHTKVMSYLSFVRWDLQWYYIGRWELELFMDLAHAEAVRHGYPSDTHFVKIRLEENVLVGVMYDIGSYNRSKIRNTDLIQTYVYEFLDLNILVDQTLDREFTRHYYRSVKCWEDSRYGIVEHILGRNPNDVVSAPPPSPTPSGVSVDGVEERVAEIHSWPVDMDSQDIPVTHDSDRRRKRQYVQTDFCDIADPDNPAMSNLVSFVTCEICLEPHWEHIYCVNNHKVCSKCKSKTLACPFCKGNYTNLVDVTADKLYARLFPGFLSNDCIVWSGRCNEVDTDIKF